MSNTTRATRRGSPKPKLAQPRWNWRAFLLWFGVVAVVGGIIAGAMLTSRSEPTTTAKPAPPFTLTDTSGQTVSLSDFKGKSVLIYFNEGAGCDACFYQQVEIEKRAADFEKLGITETAIVMNPVDQIRPDLARFKITTPYLIDKTGSVSREYGVLGKGMHADLPGHGFVLIDGDGIIRWQAEYPTMYASVDEIISNINQNMPNGSENQ